MRTTKKRSVRRTPKQDPPPGDGFWEEYRRLLMEWRPAFRQDRTWDRAVRVLVGLVACQGRGTLTNSIMYRCREQKDWSADYAIFNRDRCPWKVRDLFAPVLLEGIQFLDPDDPIVVALDDTGLPKTGLKVPQARWIHDPLAPKFLDKQIRWGIRMLHAALLIPQYENHRPLAISVGFEPVPPLPKLKPGVVLTEDEEAIREQQARESLLTYRAAELIRQIRKVLDDAGFFHRRLLLVVDGSFTNGDIVGALPHDTELIGRFRKNARLRAPVTGRRGKTIYGENLPAPQEVLRDDAIPTYLARCHYGGDMREIKYKEVTRLYWPEGTRRKVMRMIIVEPIPYLMVGRRKRGYNLPAYLLTTDLITPAAEMVQHYLDRWQIEVLHRDLKTGLGVGQVQAFSETANERVHGATVAAYSLLNLAALRYFGGQRTKDFPELPLWRKNKPPMRVSQRELVTVLRNALVRSEFFRPFPPRTTLPKGWALLRRETYQAA